MISGLSTSQRRVIFATSAEWIETQWFPNYILFSLPTWFIILGRLNYHGLKNSSCAGESSTWRVSREVCGKGKIRSGWFRKHPVYHYTFPFLGLHDAYRDDGDALSSCRWIALALSHALHICLEVSSSCTSWIITILPTLTSMNSVLVGTWRTKCSQTMLDPVQGSRPRRQGVPIITKMVRLFYIRLVRVKRFNGTNR